MERSHKDINRWPLLSALAANLMLYYALMRGLDLSTLTTSEGLTHLKLFLPGGLAIALCGILNAQLAPLMKARIVFMKWKDPLPGCEAFSKYMIEDHRIDIKVVKSMWGPLPADPQSQNALWYRIYQGERDTPAVSQTSRHWLFARDYACVIALLLPLLAMVGIVQMHGIAPYATMLVVLLVQFLLASQAARTNAIRLVSTVIAQASARGPAPAQQNFRKRDQ
jgi:hypothetical protein